MPEQTTKRSGQRVAALLVALLGFAAVGLGSGGSASAAVVPDAITAVSVVESSAEYGQRVRVEAEWTIPDTTNPGDTFWLQLPPELGRRNTSFELRSPSGDVVATATVTPDGRVTFTVTDYVTTHDEVSGTAYFSTTFVSEATGGEDLTLEFVTSGSTYTDQVTVVGFEPIDRAHPVKGGFWTDQDDQGLSVPEGAVAWSVASPRGPYDHLKFTDQAGPGQSFRCGSLTVERTTEVDPFSGFLVNLSLVPPVDYTATCSDQGWTVVLDRALAANEIVQVRVLADITDPTLTEYTNSAVVTADGTTKPTTATVRRFDAGGTGDGDGLGPLRVTKVVDAQGEEQPMGPFTLRVSCAWNGSPAVGYPRTIVFDGPGSKTLYAPITSQCSVTEPDTGGATSVKVEPANGVTVTKDATGTVELVVTNTFTPSPSGSFQLIKELAGPVTAADIAAGTTFTVKYTVDGEPAAAPLRVTFDEPAYSPQFPVGTRIELAEMDADPTALPDGFTWGTASFSVGGAESNALTISEDGEAAPATVVTLTNHVVAVSPPAGPSEPTAPPVAPTLPATGSDDLLRPAFVLGLLMLGAGAGLALKTRGRRSRRHCA